MAVVFGLCRYVSFVSADYDGTDKLIEGGIDNCCNCVLVPRTSENLAKSSVGWKVWEEWVAGVNNKVFVAVDSEVVDQAFKVGTKCSGVH